jgi:sigma-E factor negative regulatory protein RseB
VLESSAFSEVEIGVKPRPQSVLQPMKRLDGYRIVRPAHTATQLAAEGWLLNPPVAGFSPVSCTRRLLDPTSGSAPVPTLQAVFSDGLTQVSVFIEAREATRQRQPLLTRMGATFTLMQPYGDDWWITVVGDVPAKTLKQFYQALERRP